MINIPEKRNSIPSLYQMVNNTFTGQFMKTLKNKRRNHNTHTCTSDFALEPSDFLGIFMGGSGISSTISTISSNMTFLFELPTPKTDLKKMYVLYYVHKYTIMALKSRGLL
jgi:hypothetical protein